MITMLFGKSGPPEVITAQAAKAMLTELFEKRMEPNNFRIEKALESIESKWRLFLASCEEFASNLYEPDLEDLYNVHKSAMEQQKASYFNAIMSIQNRLEENAGRDITKYEINAALLASYADKRELVLKANGRFKAVLIAYAQHLGNMKRAFSDFENEIEAAEKLVGSFEHEFKEYENEMASIDELEGHEERIRAIKNRIEKVLEEGSMLETKGLEDEAEKEAAELENKKKEIEEAKSSINEAIGPLKRVAKKYDHLKKQRDSLHEYLNRPSLILEKSEIFSNMLAGLQEALEDETIKEKNSGLLIEKIKTAQNGSVYEIIKKLGELEDERRLIEAELEDRKKELSGIYAKKKVQEEKLIEKGSMEGELKDEEKRYAERKLKIEQLFIGKYKKSIELAS